MKAWAEVEASPEFAGLSAEEQGAAREQYFSQVVAPQVPQDELPAARAQFDQATRIRKVDLPQGLAESNAGAGRGTVNPPLVQPTQRRTRGGLRGEGAAPYVANPTDSPSLGELAASTAKAVTSFDTTTQRPADVSVLEVGKTPVQAPFETTPLENAAQMSIRPGSEDNVRQQLRSRGAPVPGQNGSFLEGDRIQFAGPLDTASTIAANVREATKNPVARGAVAGFFDLGQVGAGAVRMAADLVGAKDVASFAGGAARSGKTISEGSLQDLRGNDKLVGQVTNSILVSAPSMAVGVMGGPALRTLFVQSALAEYNEGRNAGFEPGESAARAGIYGFAEALGERFGFPEQIKIFRGIAKSMPSKEMAHTLGEMIKKEIPGEQLTTAMQFLADKIGPAALKPNASLDDYLEAVGDTFKVTVAQSLALGGAPAGAATVRDSVKRSDAAVERSASTLAERAADDAGFLRPAERRKQAIQRLDDFAAEHGMPSAAVAKIKEAADGVPLAQVPDFFKRAIGALARRGVFRGPADEASLAQLDEAPAPSTMQPSVPVDATQAPGAAAETTATSADTGPAEDFTGLADPSVPVIATPVDEAAHQAAHSPTNALPEPTDAQKEAGNYQKGHTRIGGLDIAIENPQGSVRRGTAPDGTPWETTMAAHYGYVKGTLAGDGDHSDVFIKPGTSADYSGPVFVIDQVDPKTGKFDEHKSVIGASSEAEARQLYQANYDKDWKGLGAITELPMQAFKSWVKDGTKRKPLGNIDQPPVTFKTAKGSVYQVNGTSTTRTKAARSEPGHEGDSGQKEPSERTFYVDDAGALALGEFQTQGSKKSIVLSGKQAAVRHDDGPSAGKLEQRTLTTIHDQPAVGLTPVELWNGGKVVHFGNPITEVSAQRGGDERVGDLAGAAEQPAAAGAGERVQPGGSGRTLGPVADDTGRAGNGTAAAPASAGVEAAPVQPAGAAHPALKPGARVELDGKTWTVRTATDKVVSIDDGAGTKRIVRAGSESWKQLAASPASTAPDTTSAADNKGGVDAVAPGEGIRGEAVGAASPTPRKAPRGGNGPLDVISRVGGISPELIADLSRRTERTRTSKSGKQSTYAAWHNPLAGGKGPVFRAGGTADLSDLARILEENGFLEPGLAERDYLEANSRVQDILKAALNGEKPLREGDADAVEREMRRRQEAAMEAAALHDQFSPEDLHDAGLSEASPAVAALTEQMLAEAEGLGVDADSLKERYYDDAPSELTDEQYHAGLQEAIRQAITEARQDAAPGQPAGDRAGDGDRGQAAEAQGRPGSDRADRPDGAVRSDQGDQGLTLESHSAAELAARAERDAAAEAAQRKQQQELEDRARADAMRDEFTLTGSDRPADVAAAAGQRDIFSQPEPAPAPQPATEQRAAEPAPAPRAPRPDDVIELRKRLSVLQALKECLG